MLTSLISFLGGATFRMVWGEVSAWLTKRQDHRYEIERMQVQGQLDAAQHERNLASIKLQADLQVKVIEAQSEAVVGEIAAQGWLEAVKATGRQVGVKWIDAWNATIRPGVATWSIAMLTFGEFGLLVLSENAVSVCSAALGIYLAERNLIKRGK
jgi:hypothetical protein